MLISFIFSYSETFFVVFYSSFYFVLGQGPSARASGLKYPLWFRKKPQDLNSHPQVAIQAHKKQRNAITKSWISGVPNSTRFGLN